MRHRRIKGKDAIIERCGDFIVPGDPRDFKGRWGEIFQNKYPIRLEIGSGKGQFICTKAELDPDINYLACEGLDNVYIRICEKITDGNLKNIKIIPCWMDHAEEFFASAELDALYINFCDPWPKKRHIKRRLTERRKLEEYKQILGPGKFIQFKTDNDALFDFSIEEFDAAGLKLIEMSRDLHNSPYEVYNVHTEYEDKFSGSGKSINYCLLETQ